MRRIFTGLLLLMAIGVGGYFIVSPALGLVTDQAPLGGNAFTTDTLNPPTSLTATGGSSSINLGWTATVDSYAAGYRIFRGTTSGGPYSQIGEVTPRTTTTYTDSTASSGITYYYVVQSYHATNWTSLNSNEASAMLVGPQTYYIHNNPTPPSGNTNSQSSLPFNLTAPTATTLYNYDQDRDAFAGRLLLKGGSGAGETDLTRYQNWRTVALSSNLVISGNVDFVLWSAIKDFGTGKRGVVSAYLRDFNGSTYTTIASATIDQADWSGGSTTWVQKTFTFTGVSYTVPAGNRLELKIIVGSLAADDIWFAYDTTGYPSRITIP